MQARISLAKTGFTVAAIVLVLFVILRFFCPMQGIAFSKQTSEEHKLKNRTSIPTVTDFDPNITLASLLAPGEDSHRWSVDRAARIEGYVVSIGEARVELTNCYCRKDIHINLALQPGADSRGQVVVEITPRMRDWASSQGLDWSVGTLQKTLLNHWCAFEGWLFFDANHVAESEQANPGGATNWRATAWEIHPVTKLQVIK